MDTVRITITQQAAERDVEEHEDHFVRQVDDRALPAPQVLAEQQIGIAGKIPGPLFIP